MCVRAQPCSSEGRSKVINCESDSRSFTGMTLDVQKAMHFFGAPFQICQAVAGIGDGRVETQAVSHLSR